MICTANHSRFDSLDLQRGWRRLYFVSPKQPDIFPLDKNLKHVIAQIWNIKHLLRPNLSFFDTTHNLQKFHGRQQILLFYFTEDGKKSVFNFFTNICRWNHELENPSQIVVDFINFVLWPSKVFDPLITNLIKCSFSSFYQELLPNEASNPCRCGSFRRRLS